MYPRIFKLGVKHVCETRRYFKVGDKMPINFIKDAEPIVIKEDKEYPEWVFHLHEKLPTKSQMIKKVYETGIENLHTWNKFDLRRTKRLITRDQIKKNNSSASDDD